MPAKPKKKEPPKRGRPPKWHDANPELARRMVGMGMTHAEVAEYLGVNPMTIWRWKMTRPDFCEALKDIPEAADRRMVHNLYQKACGYTQQVEKVFANGFRTMVTEHVPPDTAAIIFWLKNRDPENWRDKVEYRNEHVFQFIGAFPPEAEWLSKYGTEKEPIRIEAEVKGDAAED